MLTIKEITRFLEEDRTSDLKREAKEGWDYYEGRHDILQYRMFYWNADGNLVEDKTRSNVKIPHPFFTELVDQAVQHILSGEEGIVQSDDPELQTWLDRYFNQNETFLAELSETITGQQAKGFDYLYAYKGDDDRLVFEHADCLGVVEVEGRFAEDGKDQRIYQYLDFVDKEGKKQWKILVIDDEHIWYYRQPDNGKIEEDDMVELNPRPHAVYRKQGKQGLYTKKLGFLPFFRLDNNKKRRGLLPSVKPLIDDYDLMASSLSNNLIDFDTPIHVVKGFEGDDLDQLQQNLKTKKIIGMETAESGAGVEVKTVDIPYEARQTKLELDEKNIYRFGMGLNMSGLKDTSATTNIAIKAAYSLLELRCGKIIIQLKQFLRGILKVVLAEINEQNGTDYQAHHVTFHFKPEIMSNAQENAQNALTQAQEQQTRITTLLNLAMQLDQETLMQRVCEVLDIDYESIKDKLPDAQEAEHSLAAAEADLKGTDQNLDSSAVKSQAEDTIGKPLNGVQTNSLLSVIAQYKAGGLTAGEAVAILSIAIGITEERARKLLQLDVEALHE